MALLSMQSNPSISPSSDTEMAPGLDEEYGDDAVDMSKTSLIPNIRKQISHYSNIRTVIKLKSTPKLINLLVHYTCSPI